MNKKKKKIYNMKIEKRKIEKRKIEKRKMETRKIEKRKMETRKIEQYILDNYKQKKNRSVEQQILFSGHIASTVAIMIWILLMLAIFDDNYSLVIVVLILSLIVIVATPITAIYAIRFSKKRINNIMNEKTQKKISLISMSTGTAVLLGGNLARSIAINTSDSANIVTAAMVLSCSILLAVFIASIQYYRVHLIRKYCPHLKDRRE